MRRQSRDICPVCVCCGCLYCFDASYSRSMVFCISPSHFAGSSTEIHQQEHPQTLCSPQILRFVFFQLADPNSGNAFIENNKPGIFLPHSLDYCRLQFHLRKDVGHGAISEAVVHVASATQTKALDRIRNSCSAKHIQWILAWNRSVHMIFFPKEEKFAEKTVCHVLCRW